MTDGDPDIRWLAKAKCRKAKLIIEKKTVIESIVSTAVTSYPAWLTSMLFTVIQVLYLGAGDQSRATCLGFGHSSSVCFQASMAPDE